MVQQKKPGKIALRWMISFVCPGGVRSVALDRVIQRRVRRGFVYTNQCFHELVSIGVQTIGEEKRIEKING